MERGYKWVALYAVIILGGGAVLSWLNLMPWVSVGVPVLVALAVNELSHRPKPLTFDERRDARRAAAAANPLP